jgi:gentisate 1,2-dioxygenase
MSQSPFLDRTDLLQAEVPPTKLNPAKIWCPVIVTKEQLDAEIDRLASLPAPKNGRREALVMHPFNTSNDLSYGLAVGTQVTLSVLLPGEKTKAIRHTSNTVNFCIQGSGYTLINGKRISFNKYDVWNHPSWATYTHHNDSDDVQVRLTYSNAPLLEHLKVHFFDEEPPVITEGQATAVPDDKWLAKDKSRFDSIDLGGGALLSSYETLVNPPVVRQDALHWPWKKVEEELEKLEYLGQEYEGRRLFILQNLATGRTNGTTNSFFASITTRPMGIVDKPHRHASASINYYMSGNGTSRVEGTSYDWKAGDLMLSAPGWAIHHHTAGTELVRELTIQDLPMHLALDSALWQEDLKESLSMLGSNFGFDTNR